MHQKLKAIRQMRPVCWACFVLLLSLTAAGQKVPGTGRSVPPQQGTVRPNIVLIVADDLGYGSLGCYGQKRIRTPHLDRFATEGMRFTRFYAGNAVCAPSRCALMTGKHMGHAYVRGNVDVRTLAPADDLRAVDTTLAQRLQRAGYRTGIFGKWGLGSPETAGSPHLKGWDAFLGHTTHQDAHHYYYTHLWTIANGRMQRVPTDTAVYNHELIMQGALGFLRQAARQPNQPFFLYLPVCLPHVELRLPARDLAPYLTADGQSQFPEKLVKGVAMPHATYAAMITCLDRDVQRVLDQLNALKVDQNTVVLFTSDNGGDQDAAVDGAFFESNGPLRGIKRDMYEGGLRVPMIVRWPGRVNAGSQNPHPAAFWDLMPTFCDLARCPQPPGTDGLSLVPLLTGRGQQPEHAYLYWEFYHPTKKLSEQALLAGDWKIIRTKMAAQPPVVELYNLAQDEGEQHDRTATEPGRVRQLVRLLDQATTSPETPAVRDIRADMTQP